MTKYLIYCFITDITSKTADISKGKDLSKLILFTSRV